MASRSATRTTATTSPRALFKLLVRISMISAMIAIPAGYLGFQLLKDHDKQIIAGLTEIDRVSTNAKLNSLLFDALDHRNAVLNGNRKAADKLNLKLQQDLGGLRSGSALSSKPPSLDQSTVSTISQLAKEVIESSTNLPRDAAVISHSELVRALNLASDKVRASWKSAPSTPGTECLLDSILVQLPRLARRSAEVRDNAVLGLHQNWSSLEFYSWAATNRNYPFEALDEVKLSLNQFLDSKTPHSDSLGHDTRNLSFRSDKLKSAIRRASLSPEARVNLKRIATVSSDQLLAIRMLHSTATESVIPVIRKAIADSQSAKTSTITLLGFFAIAGVFLLASYAREYLSTAETARQKKPRPIPDSEHDLSSIPTFGRLQNSISRRLDAISAQNLYKPQEPEIESSMKLGDQAQHAFDQETMDRLTRLMRLSPTAVIQTSPEPSESSEVA